jgi:hypothetical protein
MGARGWWPSLREAPCSVLRMLPSRASEPGLLPFAAVSAYRPLSGRREYSARAQRMLNDEYG